MRAAERRNLEKVKILLRQRGVQNVERFDYHEANQLLAEIIAKEVAG